MKRYSEAEDIILFGGDMLFSGVLERTESRQKSIEIIISAIERYIRCRKKFRNLNERYKRVARYCGDILGKPMPSDIGNEKMTDEEREMVLSAARMYIKSGGGAKKHYITVLVALCILIVLVLVAAYYLLVVYSDLDFSSVNRAEILYIGSTPYQILCNTQ